MTIADRAGLYGSRILLSTCVGWVVLEFAETTKNLISQSFTLTPVGGAIASPCNISTAYQLNLERIARHSHRNMLAG